MTHRTVAVPSGGWVSHGGRPPVEAAAAVVAAEEATAPAVMTAVAVAAEESSTAPGPAVPVSTVVPMACVVAVVALSASPGGVKDQPGLRPPSTYHKPILYIRTEFLTQKGPRYLTTIRKPAWHRNTRRVSPLFHSRNCTEAVCTWSSSECPTGCSPT